LCACSIVIMAGTAILPMGFKASMDMDRAIRKQTILVGKRRGCRMIRMGTSHDAFNIADPSSVQDACHM